MAADALTVRFGRTVAVEGLSFSVHPGSVYALLGRNGSGKSTTVRCLLGQLRPSGGRAFLLGRDAWRERRQLMSRVAVVPETPDVPPEMSAADAARFVGALHPAWDGDGFAARMQRFRVPIGTRFARLSKGQRKQVSLALALATSPEVLILDDPTLGLDAVSRKELYDELIRELADRGTTVLITTHDLGGVEGVADRIGVLGDGRLVVDEDLERLRARFRRLKYTMPEAGRKAAEASLARLRPLRSRSLGELTDTIVSGFDEPRLSALTAVLEGGGPQVESLSLEEIFIALCGEDNGGSQ